MDDSQFGDVGTKLMFENDLIRVWNFELSPGESIGWHRHNSDYCYVVTQAGRLRGEHHNAEDDILELSVGEVVMGKKGATHNHTNIGDENYSNIVIEIRKN